MVEREEIGRLGQMRRFVVTLNLFETDSTDETTIYVQRWSTRVYICVLVLCINILFIQHGLHVDTRSIEVKGPSLESYLELRIRYSDVNCPCSQISPSFGSFVAVTPIYHPICSSGFISQVWIDMLVDDMTAFRFPGDFRATAATQFQVLRELCHFSQSTLDNAIQSFYEREFISRSLLSEDAWSIEIGSIIDAFLNSSFVNVKHKISFIRSLVIFNLFASGIQTPVSLLLMKEDGVVVVNPTRNFYQPTPDSDYCACDDGGGCGFPSSFFSAIMADNEAYISYWILQYQLSLELKNWFTGCWALESLFLSPFNDTFLYNQTELNLIAEHFSWFSDAMIPTVLNLTESNDSSRSSISTLDDLVQSSFTEDMITELNYSLYFEQCSSKSCFYSTKQHSDVLDMITSLLALSGGLSVVLRLVIPYIVVLMIKCLIRRNVTSIDNGPVIIRTWQQKIQAILKRAWDSLVKLNLFKSSLRRQPCDIKPQRWTTRIYILSLSLGLAILTFYAILTVQKKSIELKEPTLDEILYLQSNREFNSSLQCPCTQINILYEQLVQLQPFYHQLCSSDLVGARWLWYIRALLQVYNDLTLNRLDFRRSYQSFYLVSRLCDLVNATVVSSLQEFLQTQLVTGYLLSVNLFESQMNSSIQNFQSELIGEFLRFFHLTRNISYVNQYLSDANSGPFLIIRPYTITFSIYNYHGTNGNSSYSCSCANDINCKSQLGLYNEEYYDTPKYLVPGLYRACFTLESLLQSTFECFYDDQDCLVTITNFYKLSWFPTDFILLNSSLTSRFQANITIGSLVSELFIEYWTQSLNYSSYFALCQPVSCSYEIFRRNSLLEIVTIVLGVVGGLSVSLRVLVPFVITIYESLTQRQHQQHTGPEALSIQVRFVTFITRVQNWLRRLNVFDNPNKTTGNNLQEQQRTTYVYLLVLSIASAILLMYNSLAYFSERLTVTVSSLEQYEQLQQKYGIDALNCPCSQVSITYSSFTDLECSFHPVCTSHFVSDSYLLQLFEIYNGLNTRSATINAFTLSGTVFAHFQALQTLCELVQDTFKDARQQYLTSSVITASMIDYELFNKQTNASMSRFHSTLPDEFLSNLQLVRGIGQGNAFVSLYSTNWYPVLHTWALYGNVYLQPQYYGSCNCLASSSCTQPSTPFLPGYLVGCTPLESLLQSSLECLYEQTCIDNFTAYLSLPSSTLEPINISETRFAQKDTIETIVDQIFIEKCSSHVSYSQFFEQCQPVSCTVTLIERNSLVVTVTILFGLYGGLRIALRLMVRFFVYCIHRIIRRYRAARQTQVHPYPAS